MASQPGIALKFVQGVRKERLSGTLEVRPASFQHSALCLGSRCKKKVAASKVVTVHHAPRVLTVCLGRADHRSSRKLSQVCVQPEQLPFWREHSPRLCHKLLMLGF